MKLFVCNDHAGYWPVGTASVVLATDEVAARDALNAELKSRGLADDKLEPFTLQEIDPAAPRVLVLCDGNY